MSALGSHDRPIDPVPRHDGRIGANAGIQNLIPADELAAPGLQVLPHAMHEIALQGRLIADAQLAHARLYAR